MIEDLILKQPREIMESCRVSESVVFIPARLRKEDIKGDLKEGLEKPGHNLEKSLYNTVEIEKPKLKPISSLLLNKGR